MTVDASFHAARRHSLGASDVAKVIGCSPFGSAIDVYRYKLGISEGGAISTDKTERGNRQEEFVLREFCAAMSAEVHNQQLRVCHPQEEWASATLDGIGYRGLTCIGPVEAKCISTSLYIVPPEYYLVQVLWQCWVTGASSGHLAVWSTKDQKFQAYPIIMAAHLEYFDDVVRKCRDFWFGNVVAQVPPQPPARREREAADLPTSLCEQYLELSEKIKDFTNARSQVQKEIHSFLGYPDEAHLEDGSHRLDISKGRTNIRRIGPRP